MIQRNVLEAREEFSSLIRRLESGEEDQVVIARRNRPVVVMIPYRATTVSSRIGVARDVELYRDGWDDDELNDEIAALFDGE